MATKSKAKKTQKQAPRTGTSRKAPVVKTAAPTDDMNEIVVFAFRLTRAERDLIHTTAGSARASRMVKGAALAAANGNIDEFKMVIAGTVNK